MRLGNILLVTNRAAIYSKSCQRRWDL